jgi:hypothetical protein
MRRSFCSTLDSMLNGPADDGPEHRAAEIDGLDELL